MMASPPSNSFWPTQLRNLEAGQRVPLTVVREGEEQVLQIEIGERPAP